MSTRNGVGSAESKSKRDTCTEPDGNLLMREPAGTEFAAASHEIADGVRSDLNMVVPFGRHTKMASKRSSAAVFAK
jgi:hypothetical protein